MRLSVRIGHTRERRCEGQAIGICVRGLGIDLPGLRVWTLGSEILTQWDTAETQLRVENAS